jgi:hypothetical protein
MGYSDVSESLAEASTKVPTSQNFPFLDSARFLSILRWILGLRHGSSLVFHRLHLVFHHRRLVFVAYRYRSPSLSPSRFHRFTSSYLAFTVLLLLHRLHRCIILHLHAWDLAGARSLEGTYCHERHTGLVY